MLDIDQQRRELPAAPLIATDRKRSERVAVVTVAACDKARALRLTFLDEILAREFQRGLHRFRPARNKVGMRSPVRRRRNQRVGKLLGDFA